MAAEEIEKEELFIINKDFSLNEDEEIEFFNFYDISKKSNHTLTIKDNKVYSVCGANPSVSFFRDEYDDLEENANGKPTTMLIKEIDPTLLLINIIYTSSEMEQGKNFLMDLNAIIYKYIETLSNKKMNETDLQSSKEFLKFLQDQYYQGKDDEIEKICERVFNDFSNKNYFKLKFSKVFSFLDKKVYYLLLFLARRFTKRAAKKLC